MSSGAGDEVKAGLRNAIKTRRVAQGLDGMPLIEAKKPRLEVVCLNFAFHIFCVIILNS